MAVHGLLCSPFFQKAERSLGKDHGECLALRLPPSQLIANSAGEKLVEALLVLNGHSSLPFEVEDLWEASFSRNSFLLHVGKYFLPLLNRFPKASFCLDIDSTSPSPAELPLCPE